MSLSEGVAGILLIYAIFCLGFVLAVCFNLFLNIIFKEKIKLWQEYMGNFISIIFAIVAVVLIYNFLELNSFILICEIIIIGSAMIYTNQDIVKKIFCNNREIGKTLYKNKSIFFINIVIWALYVLSEIILLTHKLDLIKIKDEELLYIFNANEAAILIVLAAQMLIQNIFRFIKMNKEMKKEDIPINKGENNE